MLYNDPYKCMFVIIRVYMKLTLPTVLCTNLAKCSHQYYERETLL